MGKRASEGRVVREVKKSEGESREKGDGGGKRMRQGRGMRGGTRERQGGEVIEGVSGRERENESDGEGASEGDLVGDGERWEDDKCSASLHHYRATFLRGRLLWTSSSLRSSLNSTRQQVPYTCILKWSGFRHIWEESVALKIPLNTKST